MAFLRRLAIGPLVFVLSVGSVYAQPAEPEDPSQEVDAPRIEPKEPESLPEEDDAPVVKSKREQEEDEEVSVADLLSKSEKELDKKHHRYLYLGAGLLAISGAALGYTATAETQRAQAANTARQTTQTLETANSLSASASLLYGLAAVTLTWAIAMEFLPNENENPPLTFHF